MARGEYLSILGLYRFDSTIFDDMQLPSVIDKDTLVNNILLECAELEVLYPDSDIMKLAITNWSAKRLQAWERIAVVMYEVYDPFINIKRDEVRTITQERDLKGTGQAMGYVNAYETDIPQTRDRTTSNSTDTGTITTTEHFHVEGDSAITDAQDVAEKEFNLRDEYNLYDYIIKDFKNRFCLLVY